MTKNSARIGLKICSVGRARRAKTEPLARLVARDVERTALRVAHERHAGVRRKTSDTGEVDAGAAAPRRQVGVDIVDGLAVETSTGHGLIAGAREADQ